MDRMTGIASFVKTAEAGGFAAVCGCSALRPVLSPPASREPDVATGADGRAWRVEIRTRWIRAPGKPMTTRQLSRPVPWRSHRHLLRSSYLGFGGSPAASSRR
jgi:hypothetical protein